jgi:hypothetical protein
MCKRFVSEPQSGENWFLGVALYCALCRSGNHAEFTAEMMIHFSGLKNIDSPGVPTFPQVSVCLDCGFSGFTIPESELALLAVRT